MSKKEFVAQCHDLEKKGWWLVEYEPERKYARYAKQQEFKTIQG